MAAGFGRLQFSGWMDEFEKMVVRGIGEIIHQKMDLPPVIQSIHPVHPSIHPSILHLKARDSSCHGSETALEMAVTDQKTEVAKLLHSIMMVLPNESKGPRQKKKATKGGKT